MLGIYLHWKYTNIKTFLTINTDLRVQAGGDAKAQDAAGHSPAFYTTNRQRWEQQRFWSGRSWSWRGYPLNIKTKHSSPLSTGKVLTAINSSPSCGHHQMWDLRLLASFLLLIEFESQNSYFPPWTPILCVNMFLPRQFSPRLWRILHNCRRPDRSPDRRPLGVESSSQTLSSQRSLPLLRRPTHGCRFQPKVCLNAMWRLGRTTMPCSLQKKWTLI